MDMAQIIQTLGTQTVQQNGIYTGQFDQLIGSGFSFADIIQMMAAGTKTGGERSAEYMGIINTLTENLIEGQPDEQQYYPVIPQNTPDNEAFISGLNFGFNDIDKTDITIADFSGDIVSADPVQLSGLLGIVMTGNSIPDNSGIISALYKEMPVNNKFNTNVNTDENTNFNASVNTDVNSDFNTKFNADVNTDDNTDFNTKSSANVNTNVNPNFNTKFSTNENTDVNSDFNTKFNVDVNTDVNSDFNTKFNADDNTNENINFNTKFNTNENTDFNTKFNTNVNTNVNPNFDTNVNNNLDTEFNTDVNNNFNTKFNSNFDTNVNTDENTNVNTDIDNDVNAKFNTGDNTDINNNFNIKFITDENTNFNTKFNTDDNIDFNADYNTNENTNFNTNENTDFIINLNADVNTDYNNNFNTDENTDFNANYNTNENTDFIINLNTNVNTDFNANFNTDENTDFNNNYNTNVNTDYNNNLNANVNTGFITNFNTALNNDINTNFNIDVNTDSYAGGKTTAYEFVNKYIESGELEIIGFTSKSGNADFQGSRDTYTSQDNDEGLMDFYRTMQNAMETVPSVKKRETAEPENIGILQENAEKLDIRFDQISSDIKMKEKFESPQTQLLKGVEENLKKGSSEFTVKLRPEGLGEIIVKLVQNDGGKMLMSMTASNIKTAELLNSNLSSLQSSLSQHNVEIVNPSDMTSTVMAMTPAFEQYYGQQHGGSQQAQQFYNRNQGYAAYSEVDDAETFNEKAAAAIEKSGLDILI